MPEEQTQLIEKSQEFRQEQEQEAKKYLKGESLEADRKQTAKSVVFDIGQWKHRVNVVDYSGYDVKRAKIPEKNRKSLEDLVDGEPDRLVDLIQAKKKSKITDFNSFKKAFKEAFSIGGTGGTKLWDHMAGQDDLLLKLFAHTTVQKDVTQNTEDGRIREIAERYNIPEFRAKELFKIVRMHEIQLVQGGMLPIAEREFHTIPERLAPTKPQRFLISQTTKQGGIMYRRSKPEGFTEPQVRFLINNTDVPTKKITAEFNILFNESRTQSSIYYKRYRLLKGGK